MLPCLAESEYHQPGFLHEHLCHRRARAECLLRPTVWWHRGLALPRRFSSARGDGMNASLLLVTALAHAAATGGAPAPAGVSLKVSLQIVEACDASGIARGYCRGPDYERWLRTHSVRRVVADQEGGKVIEISF